MLPDITLNHSGYDILFLTVKMLKKCLLLFLFDRLNNHASRLLRSDSSKIFRCNLDLNRVSQIMLRTNHQSPLQRELCCIIRDIFHYRFHCKYLDCSGIPIHIHRYIFTFSKILLARIQQRLLNRFNNDFFGYPLFSRNLL